MVWIRTKLTPPEASLVLDQAMEAYGWKAGLRYVKRMGDNPTHRLSLKHFNRVILACCRWNDPENKEEKRSVRSTLSVRPTAPPTRPNPNSQQPI